MTHDYQELAERGIKRMLLIGVVGPLLIFLLIYILRTAGVIPARDGSDTLVADPLFFALLAVGISEIVTGFVLRKAMFAPARLRPVLGDPEVFATHIMTSATIIGALGASEMVYGIVLFVLGLPTPNVAVFALLMLACFRLLRPSARFLQKSVEVAERA